MLDILLESLENEGDSFLSSLIWSFTDGAFDDDAKDGLTVIGVVGLADDSSVEE